MSGFLDRRAIFDRIASEPPLIEGLVSPDVQVQPNGVDLTLRSVSSYDGAGAADFSNERRALPTESMLPFDGDDAVMLGPGSYLVRFNETVNLPLDLAALGRTRSSLLRGGAALHTAVWDAGYSGRSQSLLTVYNPSGFRLYRNARIMQLVFVTLEQPADAGYTGVYLGEHTGTP